jgi:peptide methionine sulfoxide reductase MsrA
MPLSDNNIHISIPSSSRRTFLSLAFLGSSTILTTTTTPNRALATTTTDNNDYKEEVYFGIGCFWHVQHEMIAAERTLLKRTSNQYTSRTGYAGGKSTDANGRVCYHNFSNIADYGKLGHGEVVGLKLPSRAIGDFSKVYFDLFINGDRVDTMDKGSEYRSLLGLPGGRNHPMFTQVEIAASAKGLTLVDGNGNDSDTLGKRLVYVMDSIKFPFYQAEVCE